LSIGSAIPVVVEAARGGSGTGPSGLAAMLQQLLEQTLADSAEKRRLAGRLRGRAEFRAAEDESLRVTIAFSGDRITLHDGDGAAASARVTGDFLSIAHLTSGRAGPVGLLARRRLSVRLRPRDVPFLLRLLGLMRSESARRRSRRTFLLGLLGAGVVGGALLAWVAH